MGGCLFEVACQNVTFRPLQWRGYLLRWPLLTETLRFLHRRSLRSLRLCCCVILAQVVTLWLVSALGSSQRDTSALPDTDSCDVPVPSRRCVRVDILVGAVVFLVFRHQCPPPPFQAKYGWGLTLHNIVSVLVRVQCCAFTVALTILITIVITLTITKKYY